KATHPRLLARGCIGFVNNIPWWQVWNNPLVILPKLAFQFQQLPSTKKILNPQESILVEFQFDVGEVHDSVSLGMDWKVGAAVPSGELAVPSIIIAARRAAPTFSSVVTAPRRRAKLQRKQSGILFGYSMSFSVQRTTPM